MNIKLEDARGGPLHAADVAADGNPPEVILWNGRVFRFTRTDGVWDQKRHVYRESTSLDLGDAPEADVSQDETAEETEGDAVRQVTTSLNAAQASLLKRVRERGGHPSYKAAILAGLESLDKAGVLSNEALISLISRRLRHQPPTR